MSEAKTREPGDRPPSCAILRRRWDGRRSHGSVLHGPRAARGSPDCVRVAAPSGARANRIPNDIPRARARHHADAHAARSGEERQRADRRHCCRNRARRRQGPRRCPAPGARPRCRRDGRRRRQRLGLAARRTGRPDARHARWHSHRRPHIDIRPGRSRPVRRHRHRAHRGAARPAIGPLRVGRHGRRHQHHHAARLAHAAQGSDPRGRQLRHHPHARQNVGHGGQPLLRFCHRRAAQRWLCPLRLSQHAADLHRLWRFALAAAAERRSRQSRHHHRPPFVRNRCRHARRCRPHGVGRLAAHRQSVRDHARERFRCVEYEYQPFRPGLVEADAKRLRWAAAQSGLDLR